MGLPEARKRTGLWPQPVNNNPTVAAATPSILNFRCLSPSLMAACALILCPVKQQDSSSGHCVYAL